MADRAREERICSYLKLSRAIAREYSHPSLHCDDLAQEGMLGVIEAVDGYDPIRDVPLDAHVARTVRFRIADAIRRAEAESSRLEDVDVADTPDRCMHEHAYGHGLEDAIAALPGNDQHLLIRVFGLDGGPPARRRELAKRPADVTDSVHRSIDTLRRNLSA